MAKYDGLDGYCNISEKYINLYTQAVEYFDKNDLSSIAKERGWTNGDMFESLISPLKGLRGDFQRSFVFSTPFVKAKTKTGNYASPAAFTYVDTMGIKTRGENSCKLTSIGRCIIDKRLSVQSYALIMLSKVGVYDSFEQDRRNSNLLTVFCQYAINNLEQSYNPQVLERVVSAAGMMDARADISFNALVISGILSISNNGEFCVSEHDHEVINEIAKYGESISGPSDSPSTFMGDINKGLLEIINSTNSKIFESKYSDLLRIKGIKTSTPLSPIQPFESSNPFRPYITAIKSKPFLLLAGISGTGKSRIVRELARSCWPLDSDEYRAQKPSNFEMVQVKPNWHDSSELIGYVSRINGKPEYVVGDFLKFTAKAWENWLSDERKPYFLCLDEMNLAPVEQYFAEYLSVVESRKTENGHVSYDPLIKNDTEGFDSLLQKLAWQRQELHDMFVRDGVTLPPNLIVVGTVNMDETTFSFSRKVLDRAMTIEMNEVDLTGGLESRYESIGKQSIETLIGTAVEGVDVYAAYKEVCDKCIAYLQKVNSALDGTPFKIAYRTRNEALLYVVNNLPYTKEADGTERSQDYVIARALDEITTMKILSRIEGDESKVSKSFLKSLSATIKEGLDNISESDKSISLAKLEEMTRKLDSGYTSFWS